MKFDGQVWRISKTVVSLPQEHWVGDIKNYITFGRICKPTAKGAIKTNWKRLHPLGEEEIYAVPIGCDGHSLTNLMYAKDGHKYLTIDNKVYSRPHVSKEDRAALAASTTPVVLIKQLAEHLLKKGGNIYHVAASFNIDAALGDKLFDLVKEQGVFKCEQCDSWLPVAQRDTHMSGDLCVECVNNIDDDMPED